MALLPWENLTGDASLDWIAVAGPSIATAQLSGAGRIVPLPVSAVRDAYTNNAALALHGWFDRRGGALHFEFSIEDLSTHRMRETLAFNGDLLPTAQSIARFFDSSARAFTTANAQALEAWGRSEFARAVQLDPGFSTAWVALAQQQTAANQRDEALATVHRALAQPNLASPIDRAQLQVLSGTLRGDEGARDQALLELVRLLPNDAALARQLAERFHAARRFDSAARLFREVIRIDPTDAGAHNLLGYALFFSGDLAGARKALDTYATFEGQEANAADSQGEVLFMAGQFAAAESYFLDAHRKDQELLKGGDLLKAAYARWLAGDLQAADKHFTDYVALLTERRDSVTAWRHAVWLFATGREREAVARLQGARGQLAAIAQAQLRVWESEAQLPTDPAALKNAYLGTQPALDGFVRTLYARALVNAGQTDQARELLRHYPLPDLAETPTADALAKSFTYPLYLKLRRELLPQN